MLYSIRKEDQEYETLKGKQGKLELKERTATQIS